SCLEGLAAVVATQGELAWAAELWGMAEALREAIGVPIPSVVRAEYERTVAAARSHLWEKAFAAPWARGRTMTPEQGFAVQGQTTRPALIATDQSSVSSNKPAATYPDGLTARQIDVSHLVASGLSCTQLC